MTPTDPEAEPELPAAAPAGRATAPAWRRRHPLAFGMLVGVGLTSLVGVAVLVSLAIARRPTPLTRAAYEAAAQRWDENGPASYDLDVELGGKRPGKVHVEVRDGEVTRMTRDGVQPSQRRTWYYWSVPGQLDTIEQELEMAETPRESYGSPKAAGVALWAEFDPRYGYPRRFDRIVLGADEEVHWNVTGFRPLGEKKRSDGGGPPPQ
ncbi:MAG: DUF6174 domain-containing protein [Pirellulales bacterium]